MSERVCGPTGAHGVRGRTLLRIVITAVLVISSSACQGNGPLDRSSPSPEGSVTSPKPSSSPTPRVRDTSSDGAGVEVVEQGFTVSDDSGAGPKVSYGVVVENRSADVALVTRLEVTLLDSAGQPVTDLDRDREVNDAAVNLVLPGEQQVYTNLPHVAHDDIASLEVEVTGSRWATADGWHRAIDVQEVENRAQGDSGMMINFTAESPYRGTVQPVYTYALFRSATGQVVGGSGWNDATPHEYPEGVVDGTIDIAGGVPDDTAEVEVYVDPLLGP